jgi:hypothetical protein
MMVVDRNAREIPFGKTLGVGLAKRGVHVPEHESQAFRPRTKMIEQPDQYQLGIRLRVHPELNGVSTLARLDQSDIAHAEFLKALRRHRI